MTDTIPSTTSTTTTNTTATTTTSTNTNTTSTSSTSQFRVLALYKFVTPQIPRERLPELQSEIETTCRKHRARGTLLLAEEGINGTICYPWNPRSTNENDHQDSTTVRDELLEYLQGQFDQSLRIRISESDSYVFARLKVKVKSEIVTMNQQEMVCPVQCVGTYVPPEQWNQLIQDPNCLVIDTRNDYEVQLGTFRNAINPQTQHFTEFPDWMQRQLQLQEQQSQNTKETESSSLSSSQSPKKIAMFCTLI